jgi:hypothetical protein
MMQDKNGSDSAYLVPGTGVESTPKAEHRAPKTEPENAHTGYASCILHP